MAQETEPVAAPAATPESPSSKRRNRKKGKRGSTGDDDGDEHDTAASVSPMGDVATGDLISLPSPVSARAAGDGRPDIDSTTPVVVETKVKEDGLLKLPVFPSSGRIPRTPPSSPEHFLVHSPEKEQFRVAPMSPDVHQLMPTVETSTNGEVTSAQFTDELLEMEQAATAEQEEEEEATRLNGATSWVTVEDVSTTEMEEGELVLDGAVEQETAALSSTLADMSLTNGSELDSELTEPEVPVEKPVDVRVTEVVAEQQQLPVPDDNVEDYLKKLDAEREQRRLEEEQQFSFKPEINEPPEEIKVKVNERASPEKSIFERLYDEKDKMKEKIEMGAELKLQKEMAECTFRPQIELDALPSNGEPAPPVWERF
ncbi:hypothetical protein PInf_004144 [Phytophthora infestans]|nr:hypothetical protein PInf_004144 [Phytophthora infestans]